MKTTRLFGVLMVLSAAAIAHGQGRGNGGGNPGAGAGRPAGGFPASRPSAAERGNNDHVPGPRADRPDKPGDLPRADHAPRSASAAAQELSASMHEINQTAFAQRRQLLDSVDMRLKSSRDAMKQIQTDARASRADARAEFKSSLAAVKTSEKDVDEAVKAAKKAKPEEWEAKRAALAHAHQNYADALTKLDSVSHAPAN
jgi:hypothetical protein